MNEARQENIKKDIAKAARKVRKVFVEEVTLNHKTVPLDEEKLTREKGKIEGSVGKTSEGHGV